MYIFRLNEHKATFRQRFGRAVVRVQGRTFGDDENLEMVVVVRAYAQLIPPMEIDPAVGEIEVVAVIDMPDVFLPYRFVPRRLRRFRKLVHALIVTRAAAFVNRRGRTNT